MILSKIIYFAILANSLVKINVLAETEDFYKLLGVEKTATQHEIKKAFRRLALQYHPDKNSDEGAEEQFKKIVEAYEILSDESQRKKYDQFGHAGKGFGGFGGGFGNFDFTSFFKQFDEQFSQFAKNMQSKQRDRAEKRRERAEQRKKTGGRFTINLDDLFSDLDFDEFKSFSKTKKSFSKKYEGDQTLDESSTEHHGFGGGDSFFGTHFNAFNTETIMESFQKGFEQGVNAFKSKTSQFSSQTCRKVTKEIGGTVLTYNKCY